MSDWSPLAAAMAAAVDEHRTRKVPFRALAAAAAAVDVSGAGAASWRARLAAAIEELAAARAIELPSARSAKAWDTAADPPVPLWVMRPAPPEPERAECAPVVWDAALSFVGMLDGEDRLTEQERSLLVAVNEWLRANPDPLMVPIRERSFELLGDEKVLERYRRGRLFGPGRLTDELLGIEPGFAPVDTTAHGDRPADTWLVVENWTTYRTLGWAADRSSWSGTLLWGAGNQAVARLGAAADMLDAPRDVAYFGDVDVTGLRLARDVVDACPGLELPTARPARGLYRLLLGAGRPVRDGRRRTIPSALADWLARWFDDDRLVAEALGVASSGRLPQEAVGRRLLAGRELAELVGTPGW